MLRRALVTGGAGFIGSHVVAALQAQAVDVTVIDDLSRGRIENLAPGTLIHPLDIASRAAASIVREGEFDTVFHLAAQVDLRASVCDAVNDARVNVLGALNVIEAVRQARGGARIIFASTGGAIYDCLASLPCNEQSPKEPDSAYGSAKLSVEHYLRYFERVHGVPSLSLRYANVYGPRQNGVGDAGVVAVFSERLARSEGVTIFGDGRQTRDFVYVADVARANVLAATVPLPASNDLDDRAVNIASGVETEIGALAATLQRLSGCSTAVEMAPRKKGEASRSCLDPSKAARLLSWKAEYSVDRGLEQTFTWFANRERSNRRSVLAHR